MVVSFENRCETHRSGYNLYSIVLLSGKGYFKSSKYVPFDGNAAPSCRQVRFAELRQLVKIRENGYDTL